MGEHSLTSPELMLLRDGTKRPPVSLCQDVFDRMDCLVVFRALPAAALDGSGFAAGAAIVPFKTYDVVRTRLQIGVTGLLVAARTATRSRFVTLG